MFGSRILILVPHPDDEVVGCCATIGRAQRAGAQIFALYLTHGCIARATLWPWERKHYEANVARRLAEAEEAARLLKITPVGWSNRPTRHVWREAEDVRQEILNAIAVFDIDQLWVPAYEGGHADHDGLNGICASLGKHYDVLEFAEYNFAGGQKNAQTFPFLTGTEVVVELTPEEQERKRAAIALYASEQKNLDYVGTQRETFRPLALYDYGRPPHEGTLWYTRFHWVPLRHPRVDFTKPQDVCAAISALA